MLNFYNQVVSRKKRLEEELVNPVAPTLITHVGKKEVRKQIITNEEYERKTMEVLEINNQILHYLTTETKLKDVL